MHSRPNAKRGLGDRPSVLTTLQLSLLVGFEDQAMVDLIAVSPLLKEVFFAGGGRERPHATFRAIQPCDQCWNAANMYVGATPSGGLSRWLVVAVGHGAT